MLKICMCALSALEYDLNLLLAEKKITYPELHGKFKEPGWALIVYSI